MTTSPVCILPGCSNPVGEQGQPCAECLAQCGEFLQLGDGSAMTAEEQAARDTEIRRRYALQQECADRSVAGERPLRVHGRRIGKVKALTS